jgi:hypothetical protein
MLKRGTGLEEHFGLSLCATLLTAIRSQGICNQEQPSSPFDPFQLLKAQNVSALVSGSTKRAYRLGLD